METNKKSRNEEKTPSALPQREQPLTLRETCLAGMIMGFFAYNGSFSVVPILFTSTALIFGPKSLITIIATAFALLAAGYLHTHASRTGMSISTDIFHGFYISKLDRRNRRQHLEPRSTALERFYIVAPANAFVLNAMWETFTIFYLLHTYLMSSFLEYWSPSKDFERQWILLHGVTRYLAGCLSGISTGLINHLWQRYQASGDHPYAIFNTDRKKLKLQANERRKLLSPWNMENWIKAASMSLGAIFVLLSNIPNPTNLHLLPLRTKKYISDILVIHGGWFLLRDTAMLLFKKCEKPPKSSLITVEEAKNQDENSKQLLKNNVDV